MNNIVSKAKALLFLGMVVLAGACTGDAVEIVEQDTSWKIDDKYITDDIREQLGIDPFSDLVFFEKTSELILDATSNLQTTVIAQGNEFKLKVRITKPCKQDITLELVKDDTLLERYPGGVGKFLSYPEKSFSVASQVLKAGTSEVEFDVTIKEVDALKQAPGYILPLKVVIVNGAENVKVAKTRGLFFVKLKLGFIRENIADYQEAEIVGTAFNSSAELSFESNISSRLAALNDGVFTGSWYPQNASSYLIIKLAKKEIIKGIKCHVKTGRYNLETVRILANLPEADDFIQGVFKIPENVDKDLYWIQFKEPILTDQIKMDLFSGKKGAKDPDFTEMYLIK